MSNSHLAPVLHSIQPKADVLAGNTFGWSEDVVTVEDKLQVIASFLTSTVNTVEEARDTIYSLRDQLDRIRTLALNPPADLAEQILSVTEEQRKAN